jgi:Short C-terminal domain
MPLSRPATSLRPPIGDSGGDIVRQLKGLTELRDSGAISAQEFAKLKARLMS